MKILIIGNGGREHALAWKVAQSPQVTQVFVAPGNAGTALESKVQNVAIAATDIPKLLNFVCENAIDLTIVGPEAPLAAGIVDQFQAQGLACFGPTQAAAQLESSKAFCKDFLAQYQIPTANYATFTEIAAAQKYLKEQKLPIVIKADGLAAGKGVVIAHTLADANAAINNMLADNAFGEAGHRIVIEEFLTGEEASFIVMVDGKNILPLATSQDHKARDNGDRGPNTGGMGAYSPAPVITPEMQERIMHEIILPTVNGMAAAGQHYTGFLYAGLMITASGPKVLEFNCRLGDPETEPMMLRLKSDLITLCLAALEKKLDQVTIVWDNRPALGVVLVSKGYPEKYLKGEIITGIPSSSNPDWKIFHAGTAMQNGNIVTASGRVLCVTALGNTVLQAQQLAYEIAQKIHWKNIYYRTDIGYRAIEREKIIKKMLM